MSKTIANVDVMGAKVHGEPVASEGQEAQLEARHSVGSYGPDAWPINWNGIVLGMLAAVAGLMLCGLTGVALKAHAWGTDQVLYDFKTIGMWSLACSIFGTFFSFAAAGWIAGQIAGFRKAEPCMLHGACAWLLTVPILAYLAASGAGAMFGGWLSGMSPNHPGWNARTTVSVVADPTAPERTGRIILTDEKIAAAARNTALGVAAALLMGLMGGVIGGWMSSGEPMTFTYYKTRGAPRPAY